MRRAGGIHQFFFLPLHVYIYSTRVGKNQIIVLCCNQQCSLTISLLFINCFHRQILQIHAAVRNFLSNIIGINAVLYSHFLYARIFFNLPCMFVFSFHFCVERKFVFVLYCFWFFSLIRQSIQRTKTQNVFFISFDRRLDMAKPFLCFLMPL